NAAANGLCLACQPCRGNRWYCSLPRVYLVSIKTVTDLNSEFQAAYRTKSLLNDKADLPPRKVGKRARGKILRRKIHCHAGPS
ncbi:hypothetical protein ACFL2H_12750, partial [Planctomycetota bacterium]